MRIGYAYPFKVWPTDGGNKIHAYQLIRRFLKAGHDVVTLGDPSIAGVTPASDPDTFLRLSDIAYLRVDAFPLNRLPGITAIMRNARIPMVVELNAPANEMLAFSWLGGRDIPAAGLPRVLDRARRRLHATRVGLRVAREEGLRRELAKRWQMTICVSRGVAQYARQALGVENVLVVPNGSDPVEMNSQVAPVHLGVPKDHLVVFFAGSPKYPWQGLRLLGTVIQSAWEERLPMHFLLLGHQQSDVILSLPNVRWETGVPYHEMARYINAADVCVSLQPEFFWSPWGFHGSPMKFFDYLACGKPVLASNVGQMREVILAHECGVLCEYETQDVKNKLLELASDDVLRRRMGENGRRAVELVFNWDVIAKTTLDVFQSLLTRTGD